MARGCNNWGSGCIGKRGCSTPGGVSPCHLLYQRCWPGRDRGKGAPLPWMPAWVREVNMVFGWGVSCTRLPSAPPNNLLCHWHPGMHSSSSSPIHPALPFHTPLLSPQLPPAPPSLRPPLAPTPLFCLFFPPLPPSPSMHALDLPLRTPRPCSPGWRVRGCHGGGETISRNVISGWRWEALPSPSHHPPQAAASAKSWSFMRETRRPRAAAAPRRRPGPARPRCGGPRRGRRRSTVGGGGGGTDGGEWGRAQWRSPPWPPGVRAGFPGQCRDHRCGGAEGARGETRCRRTPRGVTRVGCRGAPASPPRPAPPHRGQAVRAFLGAGCAQPWVHCCHQPGQPWRFVSDRLCRYFEELRLRSPEIS